MARTAAKWSHELRLKEGALGPIAGRKPSQIITEGLKRAVEAGEKKPQESVRKRLQVLLNLGHPESDTIRKALASLSVENPLTDAAFEVMMALSDVALAAFNEWHEGRATGIAAEAISDEAHELRQQIHAGVADNKLAPYREKLAELKSRVKHLGAAPVARRPRRGHTQPPRTRSPQPEAPMAERKMPNTPGIRLARAIMKATSGVIPKGTPRAKRGAIIKAANSKLQPRVTSNSIPSVDEIKAALRAALGAKPSGKKAAKKKAAKKKAAKKKAAKKKAAGKKAAGKKAAGKKAAGKKAAKKPRSAKQKAATKRMQRAAAAARAGKPAPKKAAKKARKRPAGTLTEQRAAATQGRARGKSGRGGVVPLKGGRQPATPSAGQREVAAAFGNVGSRASKRELVNLTGEGVNVGKVTRVYYRPTGRSGDENTYKHTFKKSQRPTLYMPAAAWNTQAKERGVTERVKPAKRDLAPMSGGWVELGEVLMLDVLVGKRMVQIAFGSRGSFPRVLANSTNTKLAMTYYGGGMNHAPVGERVMFLQHARTPVVTTRGIVS